ncbi:MAG TPA: DUF5372 family protein, partial [Terriglobia bacterium]|nr:DUF5372 family protein [Terriglobia bacterium]
TTPDGGVPERVRIVHPFHPLHGQSFHLVATSRRRWGEDRVTLELAEKSFGSVPVGWTDLLPPDPYLSLGKGRSHFRVEDLLVLVDLIGVGRGVRRPEEGGPSVT